MLISRMLKGVLVLFQFFFVIGKECKFVILLGFGKKIDVVSSLNNYILIKNLYGILHICTL